jgi:hypothetical protein
MNAAAPRHRQALTPWRTSSMTLNDQFGETDAMTRDQDINCDVLAAEYFSPADTIAVR